MSENIRFLIKKIDLKRNHKICRMIQKKEREGTITYDI